MKFQNKQRRKIPHHIEFQGFVVELGAEGATDQCIIIRQRDEFVEFLVESPGWQLTQLFNMKIGQRIHGGDAKLYMFLGKLFDLLERDSIAREEWGVGTCYFHKS